MRTRFCTVRRLKYSVTKSFKLTPEQAAKLDAMLDGRSFSDTIRAKIDGLDIPPPTKRPHRVVYVDPEIKTIVAGIGNNMNQLTRSVHTVALKNEKMEILVELLSISRRLDGLDAALLTAARASSTTPKPN